MMIVRVCQGSVSPLEVIAMPIDLAFLILGANASIERRIGRQIERNRRDAEDAATGTKRFSMSGSPALLSGFLRRGK